MDRVFWQEYARNAADNYNPRFAEFLGGLAASLRCTSVLEIGCNAGNDLRGFSRDIAVHGVDHDPDIIGIARGNLQDAEFRTDSAGSLSYGDSEIDFVFTHGFLSHADDALREAAISEMLRVAARYVAAFEMPPGDAKDGVRGIDVRRALKSYDIRVISNVRMHEDIEPKKPVFTLIAKS